MPLTRRNESPDPLGPVVIVLWHRKWFIAGLAILAFLASYLTLRYFPEEFETSAEIYISRLNAAEDVRHPDAVAVLAKSDYLLNKVRDAYVERFRVPKPVFEDFVKQFKTKTTVLQDTAVKKDFLPIVELTVRASGTEESKFLMDAWTRLLVEDFGNYVADEAKVRLTAAQVEEGLIETEIRESEEQLARTSTELAFAEKILAEKMNLLAPSELRRPLLRQTPGSGTERGGSSMQVSIDQEVGASGREPGLMAKLTEARINLALARTDGQTSDAQRLQRLTSVLETVAADVAASVTQLQGRVGKLLEEQQAATREVETGRTKLREMHTFSDKLNVIASTYLHQQQKGLSAGGDFQVLTSPVLPDRRVWPKRTLVAAIVAALVFFVAVAAFGFNHYLGRLQTVARSGPEPEEPRAG